MVYLSPRAKTGFYTSNAMFRLTADMVGVRRRTHTLQRFLSLAVVGSGALFATHGTTLVSQAAEQQGRSAAQPLTSIPFDVTDGRILIKVSVNGSGPFRMIFDSGASAAVSPEVAKQLHLQTAPSHLESGTGTRQTEVASSDLARVDLGSVHLSNLKCDVLAMTDMPPVFGNIRIDGILGRPVFDHFTVQVNYDRRLLLLFDPSRYTPASSDAAVAFTRIRDVPLIRAIVNGQEGMFGVDLGARSSLLLNRWFAEAHQLLPMFEGAPEMITGWGLGGPIRGKLGRANTFDLAGEQITSPIVRLSTQTSGLLSRTDTAGLIGADILRQFTLTFDPVRETIYFRRSKAFGVRTEFDKSGMWLTQAVGAFKVIDVVPGGAADRAGIHVGDEVLTVNGRSASRILLPELRDEWSKQPAGTSVQVKIAREHIALRKEITLRALV